MRFWKDTSSPYLERDCTFHFFLLGFAWESHFSSQIHVDLHTKTSVLRQTWQAFHVRPVIEEDDVPVKEMIQKGGNKKSWCFILPPSWKPKIEAILLIWFIWLISTVFSTIGGMWTRCLGVCFQKDSLIGNLNFSRPANARIQMLMVQVVVITWQTTATS